MKCIVALISLLLSSALFAAERELTFEIEALDTAGIATANVWDFSVSNVLRTDRGLSIKEYGDSLLGEYAAGHREWFAVKGDTLFYAGEEEINYLVSADSLHPAYIFPLRHPWRHKSQFRNRGRIYARYPYAEEGTAATEVCRAGSLILPGGDTLRNVILTREERIVRVGINTFAAEFPLQPADSLNHFNRRVYRWYHGGGFMPVAVQTVTCRTDARGERLSSFARAYVVDPTEYALINQDEPRLTEADADNVREALRDAEVIYSNGSVKVSLSLDGELPATFFTDVVDVPGNLYRHSEHTLCGEGSFTVNVADLPPREYVVVLTSSAAQDTVEKRYIKIH